MKYVINVPVAVTHDDGQKAGEERGTLQVAIEADDTIQALARLGAALQDAARQKSEGI